MRRKELTLRSVLADSGTPRLGCRTAVVVTKLATNTKLPLSPDTDNSFFPVDKNFQTLNIYYIFSMGVISLNLNFMHPNQVIFYSSKSRGILLKILLASWYF